MIQGIVPQKESPSAYRGLRPAELWLHFAALNRIPRPSGHEGQARAYVQRIADASSAQSAVDRAGNIVVYKSATRTAFRNAPVVAIQTHLDMVCEKRPDVVHDCEKDAIRPKRVGDRIFADGTTLGADNGIGVAAALALLSGSDVPHGPLELIFTVEEEIGLCGAAALNSSLVKARLLINLDSESSDELIVGSAGSSSARVRLPVTVRETPTSWVGQQIVISGLRSGHSGLQIHEPRLNAIKLLSEVLISLRDAETDFRLVALDGGRVANAIPSEAVATIALPPDQLSKVNGIVAGLQATYKSRWNASEPTLTLGCREVARSIQAIDYECRDTALRLLQTFPHGVIEMSNAFPGKVESSSNLARVRTADNQIGIVISARSLRTSKLRSIMDDIRIQAEAVGAEITIQDRYPAWQPEPNSPLLKVAEQVYRQLRMKAPAIQVLHAGLECGVIASNVAGLQAISFGPQIESPHTPEEHVYIDSVEPMWDLLVVLLSALCSDRIVRASSEEEGYDILVR